MEEAFEIFLKKDKNEYHLDSIKKDIIKCYTRMGFTPKDYFLFGFHTTNTKWKQRKNFISDCYKDYLLFSKEGADKYNLLSDKWKFYQKTKQFFNRQVFLFNQDTKKDRFLDFVMNVRHLFIKPISSSYGQGTFVVDIDSNDSAEKLYMELASEKNNSYLVEERIQQDQLMAKWNESSVNTIRFSDCLTKNEYFIFTPFFRTGRKGSIVDNAGSGGILANIDIETGMIITDGVDENGNIYKEHPDSKITFKGYIIPYWEDLKKTVKEVHETCLPEHKYIGWDFALSKDGWVLIEGNWGQFVSQYADKLGRKKDFKKQVCKKSKI